MKKRRVVVTDYTFPSLGQEQAAAERSDALFETFQCRSEEEVIQAVSGATVALVQFAPLTRKSLDQMAPNAAVIRYGIGFDNIDLAAARKRKIPVGYVPDYCIDEVADHTAAMILASLRKLLQLDASLRSGQWSAVAVAIPLKPFKNTVVGFFGFGRIGRAVLARLRPFGFRFMVADPAMEILEAQQLGIELVEQKLLLAQADVLSLHAPATPETERFLNSQSLRSMKPHAILVNTARGKLIDEQALAEGLCKGVIGGAAIDVFETEPLPEQSTLRSAPNIILTPHAAWYSDNAIIQLQSLVAEDIERVLSGRPPRCPVPDANAQER